MTDELLAVFSLTARSKNDIYYFQYSRFAMIRQCIRATVEI